MAASTTCRAPRPTRSPRALAEAFPEQRADLDRCAALFDLVLYGGRPARREQALDVLGLDERLVVRR